MTMPRQKSASRRMWSYKTGEKRRNRVRVFEWPSKGGIWIEHRDEGGKLVKKSLGHSDRDRAKRQADEAAGRLAHVETQPAAVVPKMLTLRTLFDMYEREVTKQKGSKSSRDHDRRTLPMLLKCFGADRRPETLNLRDWQNYTRQRQSGELAPKYKRDKRGKIVHTPVRARVLEQDLKFLLAVLNWAERSRGDGTGFLLERNPLRGLKVPKETSPRRPMFSPEQCAALRRAAAEHSPMAERFVMLAEYTGHRSNSIRQLRWSDIDLEGETIRWRADADKIAYEHRNPMHPDLAAFLRGEQKRVGAIGEAWVFPNHENPRQPMSRDEVQKVLWRAVRDAAGIPKGEHFGWHSYRRAFANTLREVPLRDLTDLGGWKGPDTVVNTYQRPDESAQRRALAKLARNA